MGCAGCELREFCAANMARLMEDDECCLRHIWKLRYGHVRNCPHCNKFCTYHRRTGKKCWECSQCAYQLSPLAHTIFHKSTTPLSKWFYAMSVVDKREVRIVELQSELACTYKTAWRIFWHIQRLFSNSSLKEYLRSVDDGENRVGKIRRLQAMGR